MKIHNGVLIKVDNEDITEDGIYNIPDGVTAIGYGAFLGCSSLQSIHIPESVTNIGFRAFADCSSLQSIHIPDGVTNIGDSAFSGCRSLQSIHIPDSVTNIGNGIFSFCRGPSSIVITSTNQEEYNSVRTLLPKHLQAVADRTREGIRVRNAISVLGQASGSGFFATDTEGAPELPTDIVLHKVCQQLINTSGLANFFPPQQTRAIFERAQYAERIEPTP